MSTSESSEDRPLGEPPSEASGPAAPEPWVCIDQDRFPAEIGLRLALVRGAMWTPGQRLRVHFMGGDSALRDRVAEAANEWTQHANIHFLFGASDDANIRVSFVPGGSWSVIGRDAHRVPAGRATMNLGWLSASTTDEELRRVVLHEFGHALGCLHEHQNPAGGIRWNKPVVYAFYANPPSNWDAAKVDRNLFQAYAEDLTVHTVVDAKSIMMYPIPKAFTTDGFSSGVNSELSDVDKQFIAASYR